MHRARRDLVAVAVGLALAVGPPATWAFTRPSASAGPAVAEVLASPVPVGAASASSPAAVPAPGSPAPTGRARWVPDVTVRPAAPPPVAHTPPPTRLVVAAIGVDAAVDPVGVAADGTMRIPDPVDRVGWYEHGPAPGDTAGSVVLAGHVDSRTQGLGAMAALRDARPGHEVRVTDAAGGVTRWRVVTKETLHKQRLPVDRLFARSGTLRLVLVTCGGPFLEDLRSYRDNVVVIAEPIP